MNIIWRVIFFLNHWKKLIYLFYFTFAFEYCHPFGFNGANLLNGKLYLMLTLFTTPPKWYQFRMNNENHWIVHVNTESSGFLVGGGGVERVIILHYFMFPVKLTWKWMDVFPIACFLSSKLNEQEWPWKKMEEKRKKN